MQDIADHIPGLLIQGSSNSKLDIFIRGVGKTDFRQIGTGAVAVYRDEIYQGSPFSFISSTLDIEQVEVLKGPQGDTLGQKYYWWSD